MLKSSSGQHHPLLSRRCLQGGDVTNSAASTGFALMCDPCAVWPGPRPTATGLRGDRDPFTYSPCRRCTNNMKKERLFKSDIITHTKPNHKWLNFSFCWLNPLPLEAQGLNCGKVSIFKLDILVISEERTNVIKLTSIRPLSPSCFTKVSLQIRSCWVGPLPP